MALSSSPLPELHELIAKKPKVQTLRSESAAVPVPAGATNIFTSASQLFHATQAAGIDSPSLENDPTSHAPTEAKGKRFLTARTNTKVTKPSRAPKRVAKTVITLSSDDVTPQSSKAESRAKAVTGKEGARSLCQSTEGIESKAKPWKKFKAPANPGRTPAEEEENDSLKLRTNTKVKKKAEKPEIVSRHFRRKTTEGSAASVKDATAKRTSAPSPEPMNLESAVQRRMDWTPPRPNTLFKEPGLDDTPAGVVGEEDEDTNEEANSVFRQLRDKYGNIESQAGATASDNVRTVQPLSKRKAIGSISVKEPRTTTDVNHTPPPVKEKAPKKKPRTITEVAMAAYQIKTTESAQDPVKEKSLLDHFTLQGSKGAGKALKGKAPKVTKKTKKAAVKQPELLSPRAAMRRSAAQDFVFGTSSQLAREQSPTFLKELNAALRASNMASDDGPSTNILASDEVLAPKRSSKGLWSVSARDEDGELVDIEVVDLVDSPAFPQDNAILDPWKDLPPPGPTANESDEADVSLLEVGSRVIPSAERRGSQSQLLKPRSVSTPNRITINSAATVPPAPLDSSYPPIEDLLADEMPPPSNQQQSLEEADQTVSPAKVDDCAQSRPKYELFTDAKLSKEISSYGFKVVKSRTAMISLLDQCWRSKNQAPGVGALFSTSAAVASRAKKTASPAKRPLGRPKKSTAVEATGDTETDSAPPAKRTRGRPKKAANTDSVDPEAQAVLLSPTRKASNHEDEPTTPTKKRGRPRKEGAATVEAPPPKPSASARPPVEIKDSDLDSDGVEEQLTSPDQLFSPGPAEVSISDDTEVSLNLGPSDVQSTLFSLITKVVTSAPRTTDPSNPSWYEKMLMYDPIILEDLTAWLNSGQLTKVGHDSEVAPADVKKWCESRSFCCLWRINVHGKERKRF